MDLRAIKLFLCSAFLFSGCSVYKSSGRKTFENKAPSNLRAASLEPTDKNSFSDEGLCWEQPSDDPLWHVDAQSFLIVKKSNNDEMIQVCFQAP
jgi:hypothetical protein